MKMPSTFCLNSRKGVKPGPTVGNKTILSKNREINLLQGGGRGTSGLVFFQQPIFWGRIGHRVLLGPGNSGCPRSTVCLVSGWTVNYVQYTLHHRSTCSSLSP
jgi:hypothetical protein